MRTVAPGRTSMATVSGTSSRVIAGNSRRRIAGLEDDAVGPQGLDAGVVVARVLVHVVGVLAEVRRPLRYRQIGVGDSGRERQHVGLEPFLGDPVQAVLELGVGGDRLWRVDRRDRRVVLAAK